MFEVGLYPDLNQVTTWLINERQYTAAKVVTDMVQLQLGRRHGVSESTLPHHTGEILFRRFGMALFAISRDRDEVEQLHYRQITEIVRRTGPVNRTPTAEQIAAAVTWIERQPLKVGNHTFRNAENIKYIVQTWDH